MNGHTDQSSLDTRARVSRACDPGEQYEIRVLGHLDPCWSDWFEGLVITHPNETETLLSGPVVDQAALHGLLARVRDMNLELLSVRKL